MREWRELVRYRAKLVGLRSGLKAQAHAVLAKHGLAVPMTDLFGVGGRQLLAHLCADDARFHSAYGQRIESLVVLVDAFDRRDRRALRLDRPPVPRSCRLPRDPTHRPGSARSLAAIFVAEIGDVHRFASAGHLASWCGLTPATASPTPPCGADRSPNRASKLVRWAAIEAAQQLRRDSLAASTPNGNDSPSVATAASIAKTAIARKLITLTYYGLRDGEIRCLEPSRMNPDHRSAIRMRTRVFVMTPRPGVVVRLIAST